jgi:putative Ca2+/H+ antiporter (TMEM165/GDT1 family)
MLPGGILAERYSAKWTIFTSILGATLCTFLSPLSARFGGYAAFVAVKVIQGLFQVQIFYVRTYNSMYLTIFIIRDQLSLQQWL